MASLVVPGIQEVADIFCTTKVSARATCSRWEQHVFDLSAGTHAVGLCLKLRDQSFTLKLLLQAAGTLHNRNSMPT